MRRREFWALLGGATATWTRNGLNGFGAWASSCPQRRTMRNFKRGLVRSVDQAELGDIEKAARSAYARGLSSVPPQVRRMST
jgi:hypothetical protein